MSLECACVHYNNGRCKKFSDDKYTSWCNAEGLCEHREPSNADRIREMSDEELAKEMRSHAFALAACSERAWLEWLKQTSKEDK